MSSDEKNQDLPELPQGTEALPELPAEALLVSGGPPAAPPASATAAGARRSARRELDRAPLLLRKAALIVAVGSIVPWSSYSEIEEGTITWAGSLGAKALLALASWVIYQSHVATHGGKVPGPLAALGAKSIALGKFKLNLLVPFALLLAAAGLLPLEGAFSFASLSEKIILLLAGYTFAHIYDYEHGGRFNPIYPLMFLAPAIGGLLAVLGWGHPVAGLGALLVFAGGAFACYTMGLAMVQAKKEGDQKRVAALEARRAARGAGGGAPRAGSRGR